MKRNALIRISIFLGGFLLILVSSPKFWDSFGMSGNSFTLSFEHSGLLVSLACIYMVGWLGGYHAAEGTSPREQGPKAK